MINKNKINVGDLVVIFEEEDTKGPGIVLRYSKTWNDFYIYWPRFGTCGFHHFKWVRKV